jgi:hypothetical protein
MSRLVTAWPTISSLPVFSIASFELKRLAGAISPNAEPAPVER